MTKRILVILVTISILISLLAVSASAESDWTINMLDYIEFNDLGNGFSFITEYETYLNMPFRRTVTYVDIIFNATKPLDNGVFWGRSRDNCQPLTVESLGNDVYRAYGEVRYFWGYQFYIWFGSTYSSTVWVDIWSINIGRSQYSSFPETAGLELTKPYNISGSMSGSNVPYSVSLIDPSWIEFSEYDANSEFIGAVRMDDWTKYDALDIFLNFDCLNLSSIACSVGDVVVPFDINMISDPGTVNSHQLTAYTVSGEYVFEIQNPAVNSQYYTRLSLDLSNLARTNGSPLIVRFTGLFNYGVNGSNGGSVSLNSVTGYVSFSETSPIEYWLRNCANSLDELVQSIVVGDEEFAAQVQEANQSVSDFQEYEESLQSDASMNMADVVAPIGNISSYGNSLQFISGILHRTFTQLGDYQIVILLPIGIGIVCFIASRVRPSDKPGARSDPDQGGKRWQDKSSKSNKQG